MRELGISVYPFHSKMEDNKSYIDLASKYGFTRCFMCLLSVQDSKEDIIKLCEKRIKSKSNLPIKRLINATGTIMHTNLGRSPIDSEIWDEVKNLNIYSNNLEYNINNEGRGLRGEFL